MIHQKLFEIQKLKLSVSKDGKNPFMKSNYITLDNLWDSLNDACNELNILVFHRNEDWCLITTAYDVEDNTFVSSSTRLVETNDPQKLWGSITYFKRYNLGEIFNIITDRDDDGEWAKPKAIATKAPVPSNDSLLSRLESTTTKEWLQSIGIEIRKIDQSTMDAAEYALIKKTYNEKLGTLN